MQACSRSFPRPAQRRAPRAHNKRGDCGFLPRLRAWSPIASTRLLELENEAISVTRDLWIEHQEAVVVGRVAQQIAASDQDESRALEVSLDHVGVDAVELLNGGSGVIVLVRDGIDHPDDRARLH